MTNPIKKGRKVVKAFAVFCKDYEGFPFNEIYDNKHRAERTAQSNYHADCGAYVLPCEIHFNLPAKKV